MKNEKQTDALFEKMAKHYIEEEGKTLNAQAPLSAWAPTPALDEKVKRGTTGRVSKNKWKGLASFAALAAALVLLIVLPQQQNKQSDSLRLKGFSTNEMNESLAQKDTSSPSASQDSAETFAFYDSNHPYKNGSSQPAAPELAADEQQEIPFTESPSLNNADGGFEYSASGKGSESDNPLFTDSNNVTAMEDFSQSDNALLEPSFTTPSLGKGAKEGVDSFVLPPYVLSSLAANGYTITEKDELPTYSTYSFLKNNLKTTLTIKSSNNFTPNTTWFQKEVDAATLWYHQNQQETTLLFIKNNLLYRLVSSQTFEDMLPLAELLLAP